MAITTFDTSAWVSTTTPATANLGPPDDGALDNGSIATNSGSADDWEYGEHARYGPYIRGFNATNNDNRIKICEASDLASHITGNDGYGFMLRYAFMVEPLGDADLKSSLAGNEEMAGYADPDVRHATPGGTYTGDSATDFLTVPSGNHMLLTPYISGTTTSVTTERNTPSGKLRLQMGRIIHLDWVVVATSASTYDAAVFIDGRRIAEYTGLGDISRWTSNNDLEVFRWQDFAEDLGSGTVETRKVSLFGDYSGVRTWTSGGWDGYLRRAEPDFYRESDNRFWAAGGFDDSTVLDDFTVDALSGAALDTGEEHDVWSSSRGFNGYPLRVNPSTSAAAFTLTTRESGLSWPTRGNRCVIASVFRPSRSGTNAIGVDFIAKNGTDPYVGFGYAASTSGSVDLDFIDYSGSERREDTGINLDIDIAYLIVMTLEAGRAATIVAIDLSNTSNSQMAWWAESSNITGIPSDSFEFVVSGNNTGSAATAGQFQLFSVGVCERWPVWLLSSFASGDAAGAGFDAGNWRFPANIARATDWVYGPEGTCSMVDEIGTLDSSGLMNLPPNGPGFQFATEGLDIKEFVEGWLNNDPEGFAQHARGFMFWEADLVVNGVNGGGLTAEVVSAHIDEFINPLLTNRIDFAIGRTAIPPVTSDMTTFTEAVKTKYEAVNEHKAAITGPRNGFDMYEAAGSSAAATTEYMKSAADNDVHPEDDFEYARDIYATRVKVPARNRSRDRSRSR